MSCYRHALTLLALLFSSLHVSHAVFPLIDCGSCTTWCSDGGVSAECTSCGGIFFALPTGGGCIDSEPPSVACVCDGGSPAWDLIPTESCAAGACSACPTSGMSCMSAATSVPTPPPSSGAPTASPTSASPTPRPTSASPTPGPTSASPTPGPTSASPTPGPTSASPTPGPTSASPTPVPTSAFPTPGPTSASPTPGPTSASPTPGPTAAPIPTSTAPTPSPTSAGPTAAPTSGAPTASPTSASPTPAPTTGAPTTASPTTASPTTASPTTASPTTESPTTDSPTTGAPTTDAPTTQMPTNSPTSSPTKSPTTRAPTDAPTPAPTPPSGIFITGFVFEQGTRQTRRRAATQYSVALDGVFVTLRNKVSQQVVSTTRSSSTGWYGFQNVPADTVFLVEASKDAEGAIPGSQLGEFIGGSQIAELGPFSVGRGYIRAPNVNFGYYGCLSATLSSKNQARVNGDPVSVTNVATNTKKSAVSGSGQRFQGNSLVQVQPGEAHFQLLAGSYYVETGPVGRGTWEVISKECVSDGKVGTLGSQFQRVSVDPYLSFSPDVVVKPGGSIVIRGGTSEQISSLTLEEGSSASLEGPTEWAGGLTMAPQSSVVIRKETKFSGGVNLVNASVVVDSPIILEGRVTAADSSIVVTTGDELQINNDVVLSGGQLQVDAGASLLVDGDLTITNQGNIKLTEPSAVVVSGALDLSDATMTYVPVVGPADFCRSTDISAISFNTSVGGPPPVSTETEGVSAAASYSFGILSVGLQRENEDVKKECVDGQLLDVDRNDLKPEHIGGIVAGCVVLFAIVFAGIAWCCTQQERKKRIAEVQQRLLKKREAEAQRQYDMLKAKY